MPTANINGTTIAYREMGSGLPIILLHGFPHDSTMWDEQLAALSTSYRVIAPDLRGFGQSGFGQPFSIESLADDVHALLQSLGAVPCVLGGLSMGGYVALAFARKYPKALKGLLLMDTRAAGDTPETRQQRDKSIETVKTEGARSIAKQMLPKMLTAATLADQPELAKQVMSMMESCPPQAMTAALIAMRDRPDMSDELPSIACPTLVIVGDADAVTPVAMAEAMQKAIPNSTLKIITGAAHLSPTEQPEQVNRAISDFLKGLPTAG